MGVPAALVVALCAHCYHKKKIAPSQLLSKMHHEVNGGRIQMIPSGSSGAEHQQHNSKQGGTQGKQPSEVALVLRGQDYVASQI